MSVVIIFLILECSAMNWRYRFPITRLYRAGIRERQRRQETNRTAVRSCQLSSWQDGPEESRDLLRLLDRWQTPSRKANTTAGE